MHNTTACIKHAVFWKEEKELILERLYIKLLIRKKNVTISFL